MNIETIKWIDPTPEIKQPILRLIDQTKLPSELKFIDCVDVEMVAESIEVLRVRGAPAIGVAAAYGVALGAWNALGGESFSSIIKSDIQRLANTRPTAVNLFWALNIMQQVIEKGADNDESVADDLLTMAHKICAEDHAVCRRIGKHGANLLSDGNTVLTHCNAGGLATGGYGTALGIIYSATEQGKKVHVFADETRPLLQGSRLTAWELLQNGVDVTLICDNMAATVMRGQSIDCVIVGADRVAANGDVANKIGTYGLAVLAKEHGIPFYVAAPISTIDFKLSSGEEIPIEERASEEVSVGNMGLTAPENVKIFNPAFDVTPHYLVDAIITEHGVAKPAFSETLGALNEMPKQRATDF